MGALAVALPTGTIAYLTQCSKAVTYSLARMVLGLYVVWSFSTFRRAVKKAFGSPVSTVITCMNSEHASLSFFIQLKWLIKTSGHLVASSYFSIWSREHWTYRQQTVWFGLRVPSSTSCSTPHELSQIPLECVACFSPLPTGSTRNGNRFFGKYRLFLWKRVLHLNQLSQIKSDNYYTSQQQYRQ